MAAGLYGCKNRGRSEGDNHECGERDQRSRSGLAACRSENGRGDRERGFGYRPLHDGPFASFGFLGLILAGVGIYGVMAFGVAQRTQEFGVRMALGAQRSQVVKLVLREGTIVAVVGAVIGLGGAYVVGRAMRSTLYGVGAMDSVAVGGTAVLLLVVALFACLVPALRASRVEPMVALRDE